MDVKKAFTLMKIVFKNENTKSRNSSQNIKKTNKSNLVRIERQLRTEESIFEDL